MATAVQVVTALPAEARRRTQRLAEKKKIKTKSHSRHLSAKAMYPLKFEDELVCIAAPLGQGKLA